MRFFLKICCSLIISWFFGVFSNWGLSFLFQINRRGNWIFNPHFYFVFPLFWYSELIIQHCHLFGLWTLSWRVTWVQNINNPCWPCAPYVISYQAYKQNFSLYPWSLSIFCIKLIGSSPVIKWKINLINISWYFWWIVSRGIALIWWE